MSKIKQSTILEPNEIATCVRFLPECAAKNDTLLASAHLDGTVNIFKVDSKSE